ncbi:hypothetical protein AYK26_02460 [Euryarchaeota archaeon SM23-78]|nr:MAG: hypothetical protein AYK26_02460 [Euryarchaeota archaeon SM23-78]
MPSRSFSSSILIVLNIKGRAAIAVKNTIIRLACALKIHRLRIMDALLKTAPNNKSLEGLCSALKGVIRDSSTMVYSLAFEFINLLEGRSLFASQ